MSYSFLGPARSSSRLLKGSSRDLHDSRKQRLLDTLKTKQVFRAQSTPIRLRIAAAQDYTLFNLARMLGILLGVSARALQPEIARAKSWWISFVLGTNDLFGVDSDSPQDSTRIKIGLADSCSVPLKTDKISTSSHINASSDSDLNSRLRAIKSEQTAFGAKLSEHLSGQPDLSAPTPIPPKQLSFDDFNWGKPPQCGYNQIIIGHVQIITTPVVYYYQVLYK